ncbi:ACT domain-containing protein, partial [Kitasatospora nipponensis]|uniref:ACT domain-containing protein n=1 Tax=Kitasatospora nipponensis TaxID=258049 RepID=UPI0031CE54F0
MSTEPESQNYRSQLTVRAVQDDGTAHTVSGAVTGKDEVQKLIEIDGRHFDIRAEGHMLLMEYPDKPGIMGRVGTVLGEAGVNIDAAQ